jgi:Domain of unknown function (DUF6456)
MACDFSGNEKGTGSMVTQLSAQGQRVVEALATGRRFRRAPGGWAAGSLRAPDSLVRELESRDFVRRSGATLALGRAGAARLRAQAGGDNRLLVERALPQDAEPASAARTPRKRSVTVNLAESPLGWLKARGLVDDRHYEAGERLRGDWTVAQMAPRVTMRWDAGAPTTGERLDPTLAQIAAKQRMEAALDAVGAGLKDVLWRIVCAGEGMETAERALGWPARAGRVVLTLALDRLADHYRLA